VTCQMPKSAGRPNSPHPNQKTPTAPSPSATPMVNLLPRPPLPQVTSAPTPHRMERHQSRLHPPRRTTPAPRALTSSSTSSYASTSCPHPLHDLTHGTANPRPDRRLDVTLVQDLLGHTSISFTPTPTWSFADEAAAPQPTQLAAFFTTATDGTRRHRVQPATQPYSPETRTQPPRRVAPLPTRSPPPTPGPTTGPRYPSRPAHSRSPAQPARPPYPPTPPRPARGSPCGPHPRNMIHTAGNGRPTDSPRFPTGDFATTPDQDPSCSLPTSLHHN